MLLLPVTGILTAVIFLGERPESKVYIGGIIILIGVSIILFGKNENSKRKVRINDNSSALYEVFVTSEDPNFIYETLVKYFPMAAAKFAESNSRTSSR